MGLIAYNLGTPDAPNNPSVDQPLMKQNNDNIPVYVAVDHVGFNTNHSGYHRIIHQIGAAITVDPAPIAGISQLYTKNVTINAVLDGQLFYQTGTGVVTQLTGFTAAANGYAYAGGMLFQWGVVNSPGLTGSVSFSSPSNINFPNNCFGVQLTQSDPVTPSEAPYYLVGSPSTTGFIYAHVNSGANKLFWMAVGN